MELGSVKVGVESSDLSAAAWVEHRRLSLVAPCIMASGSKKGAAARSP